MKRSNGFPAAVFAAAVLAASVILSACGGGGGGSTPTPAPKPKLTGTVASGGAHAGAHVILKDGNGNTRTGTTDGNGKYAIETDGLTPPFFVVASTGTQTFYSISADANTTTNVNVTPLTDLIIKTWYDVQGVNIDTAFTNPTGTNLPPSPSSVAVINSVVQNAVQLWLDQNCVTTNGINLIATPFDANHDCIDRVLDWTKITPGTMVISNGSVTQNSVLSASTGSMNVVTTTTDTSGKGTSSVNGTVVPVQTAQQTALAGITTTINDLAATVNSKSTTTVTASDLLLYMDPNGIWGGLDRAQTAKQIAYFFNKSTVAFSDIAIKSFVTPTTADTTFKLSQTAAGQTSTEPIEFFFTKPTTTSPWLMSGDNQIAEIEVRAVMARNQGSASNINQVVEVTIHAPRSSPSVTSLIGATIDGGPWSSVTLSYNGLTSAPWDASLDMDSFGTYFLNPPTIFGGQLYTIGITPATGPTVTYTKTLNAVTTEPILITNLTGSTIAAATLGVPKLVQWTLPKTFAISMIRLGTVVYDGPSNLPSSTKCDDAGAQNVLGITATSATITIPDNCNGNFTVSDPEIYLQVYGINGELTTVYYTYQ